MEGEKHCHNGAYTMLNGMPGSVLLLPCEGGTFVLQGRGYKFQDMKARDRKLEFKSGFALVSMWS